MKYSVLKFCSALSIIAVFASIFAIYVCSEKLERAELWVSTYKEYSQSIDVSKYNFLNVNVFEMEEMIPKQQNYKTYSSAASVLLTMICVFCNLMYWGELKEHTTSVTNNRFKHKTIFLKILTLLGFVGVNIGTYIFYTKYIVFKTPDEDIKNALANLYSTMSEYETTQLQNKSSFYFLIFLIIISGLLCVICFIINHIRLKKILLPATTDTDTLDKTTDIVPSETKSQNVKSLIFTEHECLLISEYRKRPEMQEAVDKLLGLTQIE